MFEGEVMAVHLPHALGACAAGTQPLYRLYNNGKSGAPNHRDTTRLSIHENMVVPTGWTPEGTGTMGVLACVPDVTRNGINRLRGQIAQRHESSHF
jgi:hypothetical protein